MTTTWAIMPRGSKRAEVDGMELDVWAVGRELWRWTVRNPTSGVYEGTADTTNENSAKADALSCARAAIAKATK